MAGFGEDFFAIEKGFLEAKPFYSEDFMRWDKGVFSINLNGVFAPFFDINRRKDLCDSSEECDDLTCFGVHEDTF